MSLHRFRVDDADWHPHPISLAVYIAGVAVLAWGVHAFAQMPEGQGGASPRWRWKTCCCATRPSPSAR